MGILDELLGGGLSSPQAKAVLAGIATSVTGLHTGRKSSIRAAERGVTLPRVEGNEKMPAVARSRCSTSAEG